MTKKPDPYLIAVDGGGTSCSVAIGTVTSGVLAQAAAGPANVSTNYSLAITNIKTAIKAAIESAGLRPKDAENAHVFLGLAGAQTPALCQQVRDDLGYETCQVCDDVMTSLVGALGGDDGALLAIGTGTIVARLEGGVVHRASGWGLTLSDQASGAWLGREALARCLEAYDGTGPKSDLTEQLFATFAMEPTKLVAFAATATPADFANFAPRVIDAAGHGDVIAASLMHQGARYLARALDAVKFKAGDKICLGGGIGPAYADFLEPALLSGRVASKGTALDGAFMLAGRMKVSTP